MIWIPIVIATLALLRCIVLEKRCRRLTDRIYKLHTRFHELAQSL